MLNDGRTLRFRRLFKLFYLSLFLSPLTNNYDKQITWRSNDPSPPTHYFITHQSPQQSHTCEPYYGQRSHSRVVRNE